MAKLAVHPQSYGVRYRFYCPGCRHDHIYDVRTDNGQPTWSFNGDLERPTFQPSLLNRCGDAWTRIPDQLWMPILRRPGRRADFRVPMAMLDEDRAWKNHEQSLALLRSRSGLSAYAALCNLDDVALNTRVSRPAVEDEEELAARVRMWCAALPWSVCHLFLTDGQLQFLADCTHDHAGRMVELPELPDD